MNSTVDASLLMFVASVTICIGALLLINRDAVSKINAARVRDLGSIYGHGIAERVAKSSTSKNLVIFSFALIVFGAGSAIGSLFRARAAIGDVTTGMGFVAAAFEVVGSAAVVIWVTLVRTRGAQRSPSSVNRAVMSAIVLGGVGLATVVSLLFCVSV